MFMTTSRDSTLKVCVFNKLQDIEKTRFNFDKANDQIKTLKLLNDNLVISIPMNSKYAFRFSYSLLILIFTFIKFFFAAA
jgi:hypothetical protein